MNLYNKNEKPFVYSAFSAHDRDKAISLLQKISENDVQFWFSEQFSKKEIRRIEAAYSCVIFISNNAVLDEKVRRCVEYAVKYNKKILCILLEPTILSPGMELLLNSLQFVDKSSFSGDDAFYDKIKSAEVFAGLKITDAQKRFAKRRALVSVFVPIVSAVAVFIAVVVPLLVVPAMQAASGSLSKVGFGKLSLADLAKVEKLSVVGNESFDQWYYAFYTYDKSQGVYVNGLEAFLPTGDISDISDLSLLKNAKEIAFEANQVADISPLYAIRTLERLMLNCNPIKSVEGIEALQNLRDISLVCTDVSDISPLFKIPSLQHISFEDTYVASIEGIENCKHLIDLRTGNSNLTDISPLNKIDFSYIDETDGFSFEAKQSMIRDFSPLQRIPKFNEIQLYGCRFDAILPYISNKQVTRLEMGDSDIETIAALSSLKGLQTIFLPGSLQLTSLEGIEKHVMMNEVMLMYCPNITDFTPLLELPNLNRLVLSSDMKGTAAAQLEGADFEIFYEED